tara:strand:- start:1275 stop:1424 length:150 start_codon:yes stop_codon:yes gene_type:complete
MIEIAKDIKTDLILNLAQLNLVIQSIDKIKDKRLNSNKLKRKSWLKKLY